MNFLRRLLWNKTFDELFEELKSGRRHTISGDEIELAKAYTRRHMPVGTRYPQSDEVYEATEDVKINYLTSYAAPFTGGGECILPKGERVRVGKISEPNPIGIYCVPLKYEELHEQIVPSAERSSPKYTGYYFSINTIDLNRHFRLIAYTNT